MYYKENRLCNFQEKFEGKSESKFEKTAKETARTGFSEDTARELEDKPRESKEEIPSDQLDTSKPEVRALLDEMENLPPKEGPSGKFNYRSTIQWESDDELTVWYAHETIKCYNKDNPRKPKCLEKIDHYRREGYYFKYSHSEYTRTNLYYPPKGEQEPASDIRKKIKEKNLGLDSKIY